jgi:hypothetical protein
MHDIPFIALSLILQYAALIGATAVLPIEPEKHVASILLICFSASCHHSGDIAAYPVSSTRLAIYKLRCLQRKTVRYHPSTQDSWTHMTVGMQLET